jgi:hypothetical protein
VADTVIAVTSAALVLGKLRVGPQIILTAPPAPEAANVLFGYPVSKLNGDET